MGDPFSGDEGTLPKPPSILLEEVQVTEDRFAGIRCVVYAPRENADRLPLVLYMHGGGFVFGCSEDTDYVTRMLCHSNQVVVLSVNYRLAPETVYPGALNDCEQVLELAISQNSASPVYLAGDSAGANLAISLYSRLQQNRTRIKGLILLAPWLDMHVENYDSYNRLAPTGLVLDSAFMGYARAAYVGFEKWKDPSVSPIFCSPKDLPPTIALIGTEDPLVDQVLALKKKALDSGCRQIEVEIYPGIPHGFYLFPNLYSEEQDCFRRISDFIRRFSVCF